MDKLVLVPNVPVQIALKFADGKLSEGRFGDQMMYSLTNGQVLYLDLDVAAKINQLEIRAREPFGLCKRWTGKKGDPIQWDVWRLDQASTVRTASQATGIDPTELEQQLAASLQKVNQTRTALVSPDLGTAPAATASSNAPLSNGNGNSKPNGTNGAVKPYVQAGIPGPMVKVGYDVALRRILRVTVTELATAHEQWSDAARQDLVSTLMIQAARDGMISWAPLAKDGE